jgi:hypothetical protein
MCVELPALPLCCACCCLPLCDCCVAGHAQRAKVVQVAPPTALVHCQDVVRVPGVALRGLVGRRREGTKEVQEAHVAKTRAEQQAGVGGLAFERMTTRDRHDSRVVDR